MGHELETIPPLPVCSRCGKTIPLAATGGNCPACLFHLALAFVEEPSARPQGPRRFGAYELISQLAQGGMGVVWRARQDGLARDVALKMILAGQLATSAQVIRFYTEARAAARLDHPGIVPLYEIGEEDGSHYYTMRLMEGGSLADTLRARGKLPPREAAQVAAEVARAVHFAHQRGVLHRDLKPSNILLDAGGKPHVADFGLARLMDSVSAASATGVFAGTPSYMAPEQAGGAEVTTAADVYALGAILYETLCGVPPFQAATPLQTLRWATEREPQPPRALDPSIPRDLEVISLKCLAKQPERRYASAAEVAGDLERWLAHEPIFARPFSARERLVSWARRKPEVAASLGALLAIIVTAFVITMWLYVRAQRESERRALALRSEEAQRLAFQSLSVVAENPGEALLLALEAAARSPSSNANSALLVALEASHEARRLLGHEGSVVWSAFSPEGAAVATASYDRTARLWDARTGEAKGVLTGHGGVVRSCEFSPDGTKVLTASEDATARLWDAATSRQLRTLEGHLHGIKRALFSPDGTRVLTIGRDTARLWDEASGRVLHILEQHTGEVLCGVFHPDGARVVTGSADGTARVWDVRTGETVAVLESPAGPVLDVAVSADGARVAVAAQWPGARVWDTSTYAPISTLRGHVEGIYSLALSADGSRLATGSEDFTARIWDTRTGEELHRLSHDHKVVSVAISRDDALLLTASYDTTARVWELATGRLVAALRGHAAPVYHAAFAPDSRSALTSGIDFTARLWRIRPVQPVLLASPPASDAVWADIAPGGRLAVAAPRGSPSPILFEVDGRREVARLEGHESAVRFVRFSPDGALLLTGSEDRSARVWEAPSGRPRLVLKGHDGTVYYGVFSPDGRTTLTLANDGSIRAWSLADGEALLECRTGMEVGRCSFSPDSTRAVVNTENGVLRMLDLRARTAAEWHEGMVGFVGMAAFLGRTNEIAIAQRNNRADVVDLAGGRTRATFVHPARINYLTASPDRRWLATSAADSTVRVWHVPSGDEWLAIKRAGRSASSLDFAGDSARLVVLWVPQNARDELDREAVVYPLDVRGEAEAQRFGELTPDERDHFQVGSPEERQAVRRAWRGGHIFGKGDDRAR